MKYCYAHDQSLHDVEERSAWCYSGTRRCSAHTATTRRPLRPRQDIVYPSLHSLRVSMLLCRGCSEVPYKSSLVSPHDSEVTRARQAALRDSIQASKGSMLTCLPEHHPTMEIQ